MGRQGDKGMGSDVEVVLEAWMKWGEECLRHLYGDFAFVIFNTNTGEVFCGRDPLGVRPLFYGIADQCFIFGSELRYVLESLPVRPPVRHEYLLDTLITTKISKEFTPYDDIFRLKPGHFLRYSEGEVHTTQFWSLNPDRSIRFEKEEDYIRVFREKLVQAVNARCTGVQTLGSELSGGLDSSAVCGIAADFAQQANKSLTTFSNVFPEGTDIDFKDEREFIGAMRDFKPMDWVGVDRLNMTIPELLAYTLEIQGCFIQQNFNIFDQGIYEAAGERGIQVLFSGFGGDELVSARTSLPWNELIHDRQWKVVFDELYYQGVTLRSFLKPVKLALRYMVSLLYKPEYKYGVFTPDLLNKRFANLPLRQAYAQKHQLRQRLEDKFRQPRRDRLAQRQSARILLEHLPQRMEYCYTAAAQYGLEYRYPLLDVDLLETCLAFPPWVKQHHGINRYLFRQGMHGFVPEKIRERDDKSGTTIPQVYYSLVNEGETILDLVHSCSGSEFLGEIFDFSRFPRWYEKLVKRDPKDMNYLMPGAFYDYLMIMIYYRDEGRGRVMSNE
jgi:asparagine synthase (glutamine-hydrolysing)